MKLHKFERHAVQRRSMPEIQKADLVYVNAQGGRRAMEYRSHEDGLNDWKPRTEFERSYFGNDNFHEDRPSSSLNYYECNDHHLLKDQNSNLVAIEPKEDPIDPAEIPRRIDDYVVPHSPEFRTSRDRLHEIFEHNRYLRRKFFADLPGSTPKSSLSSSKFRSFPASKTLGFGSTETLTSQSNGSSTDGRKSRAEFGNTPDSLDQKVAANPLPLTYFGTDRDGGTWRSITRRLNDDSISQRLRSLLNNSETNMAMRDPEFRKSLPNLSDSIARLSVDGHSVKLKNQEEEDTKAGNKDKYFASYAHVTDSSDESNGRRYASCDDLEPFSESWRKSRSLLELSTSSRRESRAERMIRRRGSQSHANFKSCSDLELLSPTLVLSASRERILTEEQEEEEEEEDNSGSTPPSVYGPIPYSQYYSFVVVPPSRPTDFCGIIWIAVHTRVYGGSYVLLCAGFFFYLSLSSLDQTVTIAFG